VADEFHLDRHAMKSAAILIALLAALVPAHGTTPTPTQANVRYGPHERHVLDFWQAKSDKPTPLVFFIHGGGWMFGDKSLVNDVDAYLAAGISVVSINYRYTSHAVTEHIEPPVKAPMMDAARALQFVRSKSDEWRIDKTRIAGSGRSAGACTALWLAFHDDMADAQSRDPIARESTRLFCAAVIRAQTTLDPQQMHAWTPNSDYGGQVFGFTDDATSKDALRSQFPQFLAAREKVLPWIREYSPFAHASADDPPIHLSYDTAPDFGKAQTDPTHSANFGVGLQQKLRALSVEYELAFPGASDVKHHETSAFIISKLIP
jgi:acetyl esterase/lipase